jgi:hypothetical protein
MHLYGTAANFLNEEVALSTSYHKSYPKYDSSNTSHGGGESYQSNNNSSYSRSQQLPLVIT